MTGKVRMEGLAVAVAAFALAGAAVLAGCSGAAAPAADAGITVTASAEVKVVPDKARITLSVTTEGTDAPSCEEANSAAVNAVIDALGQMGIAEADIQTLYSDLTPRYGTASVAVDDSASAEEGVAVADGLAIVDETTIVGYWMNTGLSVSNLDIDQVGEVARACIAAGANGASGVEFYATDQAEAYAQALREALDMARSKASVLAEASGVALGDVVSVNEQSYPDSSSWYNASAADFAEGAEEAAAKVMPGEVTITSTLTVTYAIA